MAFENKFSTPSKQKLLPLAAIKKSLWLYQESNLNLGLRKPSFYPLNYKAFERTANIRYSLQLAKDSWPSGNIQGQWLIAYVHAGGLFLNDHDFRDDQTSRLVSLLLRRKTS